MRKRSVDRSVELALYAAEQAVVEAGWSGQSFDVLVGCSRGPTQGWEAAFTQFSRGARLPPSTSPRTTLGGIASTLAEYFGRVGLADGLSMTCGSGLHAVLHGMALLQSGMARRVLVGGAEAPLTSFTLAQLRAVGVYAALPTDPSIPACLPFGSPATGMALGEGAAFLALELGPAGAGPTISGYGRQRESGQGRTGISADGLALTAAMRQATDEGTVVPDRVLVHAPGTRRGDEAERRAVRSLFDAPLPLVSHKPWTGHTLGASGVLSLVGGLTVHPGGRTLVNATGFGGNAISLLVRGSD